MEGTQSSPPPRESSNSKYTRIHSVVEPGSIAYDKTICSHCSKYTTRVEEHLECIAKAAKV